MKDGGRESTCMTRSWKFHGKKNTSGGEISALWARSNPVLSPKTPAGCPNPEKHFQKNIPRRIFKDRRDAEGGAIFAPPPYTFWRARQSHSAKGNWELKLIVL